MTQIHFVSYTEIRYFLNFDHGIRFFWKKWLVHSFLKAFFSERRPVQDAKKTCLRLNTVKTIPFSASHNRLGQIRECPLAWLLE